MIVLLSAHPLLDVVVFETRFPHALGDLPNPPSVARLLAHGAPAPFATSDEVRRAVRDLLRHGGFKPTGRSKPASEYLLRAAGEGGLATINPAVDACNAVSLHSGLPISVVDLERARAPLRIENATAGCRYVFNASGQEIDVAGLVCLADAEGPCASPVKDALRTKTSAGTERTLSLVWGTRALPGRAAAVATFYRSLLAELGARIDDVRFE